jgi:hypothetical protein
MKIVISEKDGGALQLLQNLRIDPYGRTVLPPVLSGNDQELRQWLAMSHRPKRTGFES